MVAVAGSSSSITVKPFVRQDPHRRPPTNCSCFFTNKMLLCRCPAQNLADNTCNSCLDASNMELRCSPQNPPNVNGRYYELRVVILGKHRGLHLAVLVDPAVLLGCMCYLQDWMREFGRKAKGLGLQLQDHLLVGCS